MEVISLPSGWLKARLADVVEPRGEKADPAQCPDARFIGMDHVEAHTTRIIGDVPAASMKSGAARFYPGDVLYGRLRPYLNKVAQPGFAGLASAEFMVFAGNPIVDAKFLKHRLNAADFVSFASHLNEGDRPRVSFEQIGEFEVWIPSIGEQRRIVAKIEELFSELDQGIESLKTAREQLRGYRQALLKHAFEGKLTAAWREENADKLEPAGALLERIRTERRSRWEAEQLAMYEAHGKTPPKGWQDRYKEPRTPDTESLADLPEPWVWTTIETVGAVLLGRQRAPQYLTGRNSRPYLRVANISDDRIDFSDLKEMDFDPEHFEKYQLAPGDILVSEGQSPELVGQSAIYKGGIEGLCFQKTLHRFRRYGSAPSSAFVQLVFRAYLHTGVFRLAASQTVNIAHLTLERFITLPFPLPPSAEQERILNEVDLRLSMVQRLQIEIDAGLASSAALRQSILKRAFSGQLVPQDPNDEPAPALLERIRAERAGAANGGRARKVRR